MTSVIDTNLFIQALLVNGVFAILAYIAKAVSKSGIVGGLIVGIPIYTFMGWQGFVILFSMFLIGTLATKWGYQKKKEMGLAEKNEGQRGISNVLAKCLAGVIFAAATYLIKDTKSPYSMNTLLNIAFIGSFAAGAFDTVSSEIGQMYGRNCFTIIPFRQANRGAEGAISYIGTIAGIIGALLIAIIYLITLFFCEVDPIDTFSIYFIFVIVLGALCSNLIESILGSLLESKNKINKFVSNFLNTFLGGALASFFFLLFSIGLLPIILWLGQKHGTEIND